MEKLTVRLWGRTRTKPEAAPRPLPGTWWQWLAAGLALSAGVATITGIISYRHGLDVAVVTGNGGVVAILLPLVPDLIIAMSSLVLVVASAIGAGRPPAAIAALVVGVGWTVAQNVAAGLRNGPGDAVLSGGIPVAFVLTVELMLWLVRNVRRPDPSRQPEPGTTMTSDAALRALVESDSERQLEQLLGVPRSRVQAWKRQLAPASANGSGPDA